MSEPHDARLQRAQHEVPDGGARQRLPAGRTARWATAFAIVLLAGLATMLWQGRELPDARPTARPMPSSEAAVPGPTQDPSAPVPGRMQAAPAAAAPARAPASHPAPVPPPQPPAAAAPAPAAAAEAALADPPRRAARESRARQSARGVAAQRAPVPVEESLGRWTQVRLESEGASVVVPRAQSDTLAQLLARMLRAQTVAAPAPASGSAQLRLELAQDDEPLGVLESVGGSWRWQPLGEAARGLRPAPELDAQLRDEAARLLGR